ncbi:hypothetical protein SBA4_7300001 [Candidatus Sulfopaludibacter sp. SbA4]|nr:hypothetical protein SBA4_7300001 [Candidatus Sulfopaludibacter sp. SbA4]
MRHLRHPHGAPTHWRQVYLCVFLTTLATLLPELSLTRVIFYPQRDAHALVLPGDYSDCAGSSARGAIRLFAEQSRRYRIGVFD